MSLVALAVILFGLIIGSFLNVCIHRLPQGLSVVTPRSRCPHCERALSPWENIPVVSYLVLRGKCSGCGARISWVYPAVESLTALGFYLLYRKFGLTAPLGVNMLLFALLMTLLFIDLFERILPDPLTLGGAMAGFLLSPLQASQFLGGSSLAATLGQSALGALLGGGVLWAVAAIYLKVKKIEGMGFGDIKMMLMVGAFVGWRFAWLTIFVGSLMGAVLGALFILLFRKGRQYELPFGTFLAFGAMITVLWGPQIIDWYFQTF